MPQRPAAVEGGTAVETPSRGPGVAVIVAGVVVAAGIIAFIASRKDEKPVTPPPAVEQPTESSAIEPQVATLPEQVQAQPTAPTGPNPIDVASTLERALKKQRLWATVSITGARVDVRSMSCSDPAIKPHLDEMAPAFKAAGLTKLRCVEDSGRVVTDRDL